MSPDALGSSAPDTARGSMYSIHGGAQVTPTTHNHTNTLIMNNAPTYNERTARALINELTTNGGCTLQYDGRHARHGYVVGLGGAEALDPSRSYFDQVHEIVSRARKVCAGTAFGAWRDTQTGLDYVEPVHIYSDFCVAARAAIARGELALYDLYEGVEIRTDAVQALNHNWTVNSRTPNCLLSSK